MRHEHDLGRELIGRMDRSIEPARAGDPEGVRDFVAGAREYVALLRAHIQKEDACLFPMVARTLGDGDVQTLLGKFAHAEKEETGESIRERFHRIADALADHYGVPRAEPQADSAPDRRSHVIPA
jgi:hemerythrin-like domain-containing protein